MSTYEFWDELGNIFDAVVAYQQKTIEFNKRFITPWIRFGNVFDRQNQNNKSLQAYQKAIEIDPDNAENWYELGNTYFNVGAHDEAVVAYKKAIELNPRLGWAYSNLAYTLSLQNKHAEAAILYLESIEHLESDKDKAVSWNRLGNVYRKLDEYESALEAFKKADELDTENAGFRDEFQEIQPAKHEDAGSEVLPKSTAEEDPIAMLGVLDELPEEHSAETPPEVALIPTMEMKVEDDPVNEAELSTVPELLDQIADQVSQREEAEAVEMTDAEPAPEVSDESQTSSEDTLPIEAVAEQSVETAVQLNNAPADGNQAATVTFTDYSALSDISIEVTENLLDPVESTLESEELPTQAPLSEKAEANSADPVTETEVEALQQTVDIDAIQVEAHEVELLSEQAISVENPSAIEALPAQENSGVETNVQNVAEEIQSGQVVYDQSAYEVFLKDTLDPSFNPVEDNQPTPGMQEDDTMKVDSVDLFRSHDAKNARMWNELGNVYFNEKLYDDAISAYTKAIELDTCFAWSYSNLALAYFQKARFAEAVLLYQRSIELFESEKDKAVSWNRLGNVYRRLNDYDNAIAAYQRADELDPDNTTLALRARFSLLGSQFVEQKPAYTS